jgi:polyferredoxin
VGQSKLKYLRRASQTVFFLLFMALLLRTEFRGEMRAAADDIRLPYPVRLFFELDPLVAISNALTSHALYRGLLWSLLILVPTLFLGRFFCGWICPMGTLHHFFGSLKSESKRGKQLIESNRYKRWQTTKFYILIAVLVASVFGTGVVGWFDPFSLLVRSLGLSILPGLNYAANALLHPLEYSNSGVLQTIGGVVHAALRFTVLSFKQPHFRQGVFLGVIFITLIALNYKVTRFWCRALCPLGGLLGVMSRWSILGLKKDEQTCNQCNRCLMRCQGGDDPIGGAKWHKAECHLCMNCVASCPEKSLEFKFLQIEPAQVEGPNLQRRKALTSVAAGLAVIPLMRSNVGLAVENDERLLRPPGALDETDFLSRCIRCGECMKVCPNNSLHPTLTEAGLEGLWSPVLVPRIGYCEPSCVMCSQVCPTGAIWKLTPKEKGWVVGVGAVDKPVRIGTAFYDRGRCLPWAMATDCVVCEEWCPTSPKAIYLQPAEVVDVRGVVKQVKQPRIDPARCVGCGACEYACPLRERPAVYVTSIGESRSTTNQILLNRKKEKPKS